MARWWRVALVLVLATIILTAGPFGARGPNRAVDLDTYAVAVDPARFTTDVDNPFFPLRPGTRRVYEGTGDGGEPVRRVVEVTSNTRRVMGVRCVVVHDRTFEDGNVSEDAFDWYAQDGEGNVWYFGENTNEYVDGQPVSAAGNWEAGVSGARPRLAMKARPRVGDRYIREAHGEGGVEIGEVLSLDERAVGRLGSFEGVLMTRASTTAEPGDAEHAFYVAGIGMIAERDVGDESGSTELVEITQG